MSIVYYLGPKSKLVNQGRKHENWRCLVSVHDLVIKNLKNLDLEFILYIKCDLEYCVYVYMFMFILQYSVMNG